MELILAGTAGVCAGTFTNPLEVVKIRMQLQGELQSKGKYIVHYRNVVHAAYMIGKHEGLLALQKGLIPALWYQFVMNGCRLGIYDMLDKAGLTRNSEGRVHPARSMAVGAFSGVVGASVGSPLYLVKTHLQAKANVSTIAVGHQHHHQGMRSALSGIYNEFGVRGLFRGLNSTFPRVIVGSSVQLATFEKSLDYVRSKHLIPGDNRWVSAGLTSLLSGLFISTAMCPFDVVSTRIYNQGVDDQGRGLKYRSVWDCATKLYRHEGVPGFYKGWLANWARLGPHTLLSLTFWDQLKYYYKVYTQK